LKRIAALLVCLFLIVAVTGKSTDAENTQDTELSLHAKAAVLMDGDSGRVLYGNSSAQEPLPMASTTKIMTCIIVLEQGDVDAFASVSKKAQSMPKVHLSVQEGETYRVGDLLYSLMLESHNDSAVVLAEHVGGSVEGFAARMNQKAQEIGCVNTQFVTPNGLDADGHYTTAEDLARIMRYCILQSEKREEFLDITRTPYYSFTNYENGEVGSRSFTVSNKNAFLSMMEGALSGKTGFTSKAGYCYVGALEQNGKCLIVALLACGWPGNKGWKWEDTTKLMRYGLENFEKKEYPEIPALPQIAVENGKNQNATASSGEQIRMLARRRAKLSVVANRPKDFPEAALLRKTDQLTVRIMLPETLAAPVKKGTVVGMVSYYLNGELWQSIPVEAVHSVEKVDLMWIFRKIWGAYFFTKE